MPNFTIEKAGDFILIFVICLINLGKHFLLFHCMHCLSACTYLGGEKPPTPPPVFCLYPQSMVYPLFPALLSTV